MLDADEAEMFTQTNSALRFVDIYAQLEKKHGEEAGITRAGLLLARWADDEAVSFAAT